MLRLVTTPKTLYQPLLDSSIAGNGSSICSSIPGRGCSINRSLVAMNRYSGLFLECPIQLSGPIPSELEGLTNLAFLYLDGNSFIGCIPSVPQDVEDNDLDQLELAYCS